MLTICSDKHFVFHLHVVSRVSDFEAVILTFIENHILRGGPTSIIYDITNFFKANPGPMFSIHKYDVENLKPPVHTHTLRMCFTEN